MKASIHGTHCNHDYSITRVIAKIKDTKGRVAFLVDGDDGKCHVVHNDCVQGKAPDFTLFVEQLDR